MTAADTAYAADLDCAREAYRVFPCQDRPSFGSFAVNFLRERGLIVARDIDYPAEPAGTAAQVAGLLRSMCTHLPDSPQLEQALAVLLELRAPDVDLGFDNRHGLSRRSRFRDGS